MPKNVGLLSFFDACKVCHHGRLRLRRRGVRRGDFQRLDKGHGLVGGLHKHFRRIFSNALAGAQLEGAGNRFQVPPKDADKGGAGHHGDKIRLWRVHHDLQKVVVKKRVLDAA